MRKPLYLLVVALLLAGTLAGCGPAPTPQIVKQTVQVPVEVTKIVEKPVPVSAAEQEWEVVNPSGTRQIKPMELAPRITTLEGKTIALRWNGKHNGDNVLNRLAELLKEKVPTAKVIKLYETDPTLGGQSGTMAMAVDKAAKIKALKPDIVIASQAD